MQIDFITDIENIYTQRLMDENVRRDPNGDPILDWCRYQKYLIRVGKRKVVKADTFQCQPGYEEKLRFLEEKITNGDYLGSFLSKSVKDLKKNRLLEDYFLFDWNLFHFHLGDKGYTPDGSGFVDRTEYLVVAWVTHDTAYLVDVAEHIKEIWTDEKYLQIVRRNWPHLLEGKKLNWGEIANPSPEERMGCRMANINTHTTLNGDETYYMLGGGINNDGVSTSADVDSQIMRGAFRVYEGLAIKVIEEAADENEKLARHMEDVDDLKIIVEKLTFPCKGTMRIVAKDEQERIFISMDVIGDDITTTITSGNGRHTYTTTNKRRMEVVCQSANLTMYNMETREKTTISVERQLPLNEGKKR